MPPLTVSAQKLFVMWKLYYERNERENLLWKALIKETAL